MAPPGRTPSAIDYQLAAQQAALVADRYATQAQLAMASLKNAAGNFIVPSTAAVTAAAEAITSPAANVMLFHASLENSDPTIAAPNMVKTMAMLPTIGQALEVLSVQG